MFSSSIKCAASGSKYTQYTLLRHRPSSWEETLGKMAKTFYVAVIVLCLGFIQQKAYGVYMQKLSDKKLCADDECIYAISFGRAEDDYNAPDCRFINIKKGELVYIYTKLVKEDDDAGEFWSGSVYSDQYRDQQGLVGYFPSSLVTELSVYKDELQELPTTVVDFYCD